MAPTAKNGKVCYIEMPTTDVARSADFYAKVFGWSVRRRGMFGRPDLVLNADLRQVCGYRVSLGDGAVFFGNSDNSHSNS